MARQPRKGRESLIPNMFEAKEVPTKEERDAAARLVTVLRSAGFEVRAPMSPVSYLHQPQLIARRADLGRLRSFGIDIRLRVGQDEIEARFTDFRHYSLATGKRPRTPEISFDEYWLVIDPRLSRGAAKYNNKQHPAFRILSVEQIEEFVAALRPKKPKPSKGRTKIGKAMLANQQEIELAVAGLILQIDDKLEALRGDLRNDPDSIATRDARISDFERIRAELENIRAMIVAFVKDKTKEPEVVKSVTTFRDDIHDWWHKGHDSILTKSFDMGLFLSSIGVLNLMKADLKTAMMVSGALIGGKSIAGALKGIKKKITGE